MNSRAVITSVFILSLLSFAQSDFRRNAPHNTLSNGSVIVTVKDAHGLPVTDARVEVRDGSRAHMPKGGYTNVGGSVEVMGIPYGQYEVVVTKGLQQLTEMVEIRSLGTSLQVRLGDAANAEAGGANTVSVAQYKVPGKARKEYEKARKAMNARKLEEAEKRLAKALEIHPKYSDALTARAILKMDRSEFEAAGADLEEALRYDPANAMAYLVSGANLNQQSKFELAIQTLERGVSMDPSVWQGYFELGKAHVGKKEYEQAVKYLDKAQALVNFEYPPLHLVKAHAFLALRDYSQAMHELQAFLDKSPQDPHSAEARKTLEQVKAFVGQ